MNKELSIVLLEVAENSKLVKSKRDGSICHHPSVTNNWSCFSKTHWQDIHLYVVSDEVVNEPCWVYNKAGVGLNNQLFHIDSDIEISNCKLHGWKKIITTTDNFNNYYDLPKPSDIFIIQFVDSYNKGVIVDKVLVEYEAVPNEFDNPMTNPLGLDNFEDHEEELVINSDNTINIKFK